MSEAVITKEPVSKKQSNFVCALEAAELLNCVAAKDYQTERCVQLISKLRKCVEKNVSVRRRKSAAHIFLGGVVTWVEAVAAESIGLPGAPRGATRPFSTTEPVDVLALTPSRRGT
jgi:hypothetical protein